MGELHLTAFDLAAIGIILVSSIMAFARGFLREVFSIVAFIGAAGAAIYAHGMLAPLLGKFIAAPVLAEIAAAGLLFIFVFVIITMLTSTLAKAAHRSGEIGAIDRAAGLAFGAARGVLVLALFVLLMRHITGAPQAPMPNWLSGARTYPVLAKAADGLDVFVPEARDYIREKASRAESGFKPTSSSAPAP